jgi:NAD+ synthase (glutamine-hydrolysing)
MKIALCQVNPTLGNFSYNFKKIQTFYKKAIESGADLIVFPEMVVCGYPPQDLIWDNKFVDACEQSIRELALMSKTPVIAGFIRKDGNRIFNSAALCKDGKIHFIYDKILLPTYDVFDETRYFTPGKKVGIIDVEVGDCSKKIGIMICEDLWDHNYKVKVSTELASAGAEILINLSASPYDERQQSLREQLIKEKINEHLIPFVYCNLVGAQDELIFDGNSLAYNKSGELICSGKSFSEDLVIVDLNSSEKYDISPKDRALNMYSALCLGVKDYFKKTGHQKAVLGLSGGIDSSLTACIAVDALGKENVLGISMPSSYSSEHSITDAEKLAQNLGTSFHTIAIKKIVHATMQSLEPMFDGTSPNVAEENIQARIRGLLLMAIANKFGWLVLSTGNKTELALGYCTLYGDMSGGLAVISDLSKNDVYVLSQLVNKSAGYERIPGHCLSKPPSAELAPAQVDPFDYNLVSPLVESLIEKRKNAIELIDQGIDESLVANISRKIRLNEYKRRQAAPGLRVTSKAFGIGRRYPIINHFDE